MKTPAMKTPKLKPSVTKSPENKVPAMKVALVCDWLTELGGAEKVLLAFHEIYEDAPIYTSQYRPRKAHWFKGMDVRTGWLQPFPAWSRRFIVPLRQHFFTHLDLSEYDLIISVTGADAKFIQPRGKHICFCHVPTQYYWGKYHEYLKNPGFGPLNHLIRPIFRKIAPRLRQRDFLASQNPDQFITISQFAKQEIEAFYKREAKVISPPVNIGVFTQAVDNYNTKKGKSQMKKSHNKAIKSNKSQGKKSEQKFCTKLENVENLSVLAKIIAKHPNGFYLNFSRQVNWKRLDLIIKACKKLDLDLVLIGSGPENSRLKTLAKGFNKISFVKALPQSDLAVFASLAKAFIFPSEEPFGIAPVEALAAGCPVIAYKGGGALDFIQDGKNGLFFEAQTESSLAKALKKFDQGKVKLNTPVKISQSVKRFATQTFKKKFKQEVKDFEELFSPVSTLASVSTPAPVSTPATSVSPAAKIASTAKVSLTAKIVSTFRSASSAIINFLKNLTIDKISHGLVLCLPAILFLSNFPLLQFGENASMHFKLNLPLLWLGFFSLLSVKTAVSYFKAHLKTPLLGFPIALMISCLTSINPIRALFTFLVVSCLVISIIALSEFFHQMPAPKKPQFLNQLKRIFLTSSAVISLFCVLQLLADALGLSNAITRICSNCTTQIFGFPHANGLAIEPQFMGSLLIAPLFFALNSLLENKNKKSQIKLTLVVILIFMALLLTLSRGAIFSIVIALFFLLVFLKSLKKTLKIAGLTTISVILALVFQGSLATVGPTSTSFEQAVSTAVNQLTLGKIALVDNQAQSKPENNSESIKNSTENPTELTENPAENPTKDPTPRFTGYVAESTDRRLELATFALKITAAHPTNTLFGTGLGSAGTEMYVHFPKQQGHEKEIVQNQYLETILEIGIIGLILLILSLVTFIKLSNFNFEPYTVATLLAFAISLCFSSGYPNALHIYLLPVICYNLMYEKNRLPRASK
jgi:glycosyltransferase, family 1